MSEDERIQGGPERPPWKLFGFLPWRSLAAFLALALVVTSAVIAYLNPSRPEEGRSGFARGRGQQSETVRGNSCSALIRASAAMQEEKTHALTEALREAERDAIYALDTSGVHFGKPELMALLIGAERLNRPLGASRAKRVRERIQIGLQKCEEFAG